MAENKKAQNVPDVDASDGSTPKLKCEVMGCKGHVTTSAGSNDQRWYYTMHFRSNAEKEACYRKWSQLAVAARVRQGKPLPQGSSAQPVDIYADCTNVRSYEEYADELRRMNADELAVEEAMLKKRLEAFHAHRNNVE